MDAAAMVTAWRTDAKLSQYALAQRTGTPTSTIRRIENGESDPTLTMLQRIAGAAGRQLHIETPAIGDRPSLAALAASVRRRGDIDWTEVRAFADWAEQHRDEAVAAITTPPQRTGSERADNLLAAIAETIADSEEVDPPRWARSVKPLDEAWESEGTPAMRARAARHILPYFAKRNVMLGADTIWH